MSRVRRATLVAAIVAAPVGSAAQVSEGIGWSLNRIALDVVAHPDSVTIRASGQLQAAAPAAGSLGPDLFLAPDGMRFEVVETERGKVTFSAGRDSARVRFAEPVRGGQSVTIRFTMRASRPRIARSVALGAEGAFASWYGNWFPWLAAAKGRDPSTRAPGTLTLSIPSAWTGLASGRLVDSTVANGWRRERWESAQPLVWSFIAAPYHVTRHRVGETDVAIYLMHRQAGRAGDFAAAIPPMVRTLERAYGPYPFATFGLAAIPAGIAPPGIGGRSEMGYFLTHEHALDGDSVEVPIFAHELAHMWWANTVFSDPPGDDMVDEGMASYGATLVMEARLGRARAREYMREGSVPNSAHTFFHLWRIGGDERLMADFATLPSYSKGAWVYEMLRERVGDSLYFATLRRFVRDYAGRSATLRDVRDAFIRVAPPSADLERFFADWLDRKGAPVITLRWSATTLNGGPAARVELAQRTAPYRLPLDLDVVSSSGTLRTRVILSDSVQSFVVPARATPTAVRLDPDHRVMLWEPRFGPIPGVTPPQSAAADRAWLRDELTWLRARYGVGRVDVAVVRGREVEWTTATPAGTNSFTNAPMTAVETRQWPLGLLAPMARAIDSAGVPASRTHADIRALAELWSRVLAPASSRERDVARQLTTRGDSIPYDPFGATARGGLGVALAMKKGALRLSFVDASTGRSIVLIGYPGSGRGSVIVSDSDRVGVGLATQIAQRLAMVEGWPEYPGQD